MAAIKTLDQFTGRDYMDGRAIPALPMNDLDVQPDMSSMEYLDMISELIRLDVPILEIGSSSIGKSYSIREMLEDSGIKGEFLFVGTEKAEFIEGIPNLKAVSKRTDELKAKSGAVKEVIKEEVGEKFNYLKPYWFPNKIEIANRLGSGRRQMENIGTLIGGANGKRIADMWQYVREENVEDYQGLNAFNVIATIKQMLLEYKKTEAEIKKDKLAEKESGKKFEFTSQYIYADALQYLSMIQGYGNFWLILEEVDKVSEQDKDKYAPLLHIVRERELKGWKLSGIRDYKEYDIKFVSSTSGRVERINKALDLVAEGVDIDLTDTRIIAIANDLRELEKSSPALYRRFVKIIIEKTLYIPKETSASLSKEDVEKSTMKNIEIQLKNPAKFYEKTRSAFNNCITNKEISKDVILQGKEVSKLTIGEDMARIDPELTGERLDELNLQWTLGFFPDILFPGQYIDPNTNPDSVPNKIVENFNNTENVYKMMFYKIVRDNFESKYIQPLIVCARQLVGKKKIVETVGVTKRWSVEDAEKLLQAVSDYNNPDREVVKSDVIEKYKKLIGFVAEDFETIAKEQRGLVQTGENEVKDTTDTAYNSGKMKIQTGGILIQKSIKDGKPTKLTGLLMSSIPFIQQSFLSHNPYIPSETSRQFQADIDATMAEVFDELGASVADKQSMELVAKKIETDEEFVNLYGFGMDNETLERVKKAKPAQTEEAVADKQDILDKIIANKPVMIFDRLQYKLNAEQKTQYVQNSSMWLLAEKEVMQNINDILIYYIFNGYRINQQSIDDLYYYTDRYPYSVKNFINNVDRFKKYPELMEYNTLYDDLKKRADDSIAKGLYCKLDAVNA